MKLMYVNEFHIFFLNLFSDLYTMIPKLSLIYIFCLMVRTGLIYLAYLSVKESNAIYRLIFSLIYLTFSVGFLYQFVFKPRQKGAFDQYIWWDYLRPVHAVIYLYVSYLIYEKNMAFIPLLVADNIIGLIGHVFYHYYSIH
jgi:hypothetical protein